MTEHTYVCNTCGNVKRLKMSNPPDLVPNDVPCRLYDCEGRCELETKADTNIPHESTTAYQLLRDRDKILRESYDRYHLDKEFRDKVEYAVMYALADPSMRNYNILHGDAIVNTRNAMKLSAGVALIINERLSNESKRAG